MLRSLDATAAIDAMKYLTDEEKADYKQQVVDATTADAPLTQSYLTQQQRIWRTQRTGRRQKLVV